MDRDVEKIKEVLDQVVNPQLALHGGGAEFVSYEDGLVRVSLVGSCLNCHAVDDTLKGIVEASLVDALGSEKIKGVSLVSAVSEDLLNFARRILNHEA